ncbi:hypothetical protein V8B97DRAFT_1657683 [Scleroderma yunnanense]
MPPRRTAHHNNSHRLAHSQLPTCCSSQLCNRMVGRGSGLKGKAPSTISPSEHLKLQAMWSEAGNHMSFQEGHFNDLLPQLPIQPNGHCKTSKNCHDKWESLKQEYYAVSTIVSRSGLAYSAEKGADVVTEVGQLVIDDLVETWPDIAQFQSKGFRYLEHIQQFVPPSKVKGTNAHYSSNTCSYSQLSQPPTSTSSNTSSSMQC